MILLIFTDFFIKPILTILENHSYNSKNAFRFEQSDVFPLRPLIDNLNDNQYYKKKKIVFLGNSVIWGFNTTNEDSLPYFFQKKTKNYKVFNFGFTAGRLIDFYLIIKELIKVVDIFIVYYPRHIPSYSSYVLKTLNISKDDAELVGFNLSNLDQLERKIKSFLEVWNLYKYSYRIQNAIWNTSTVMALYTYKKQYIQRLLHFLLGRDDFEKKYSEKTYDKSFVDEIDYKKKLENNYGDIDKCDQLKKYITGPRSTKNNSHFITNIISKYPLIVNLAREAFKNNKKIIFIAYEKSPNCRKVNIILKSKEDGSLFNCAFGPNVHFLHLPCPPPKFISHDEYYNPSGHKTYAHILYNFLKIIPGVEK